MLRDTVNLCRVTIAASVCVGASSCGAVDSYLPGKRVQEVEISPGEFLRLERRDWTVDDARNRSQREKTRLQIEYGDTVIRWEGPDIPVVLRETSGTLYMVGYDRETGRLNGDNMARYNYYRQEGEHFVTIERGEFPKEIATQNLFFSDPRERAAAMTLDTSDSWFYHCSTPNIWEHLLTGQPIPHNHTVKKELINNFIVKYKPIKLTAIKRSESNGTAVWRA